MRGKWVVLSFFVYSFCSCSKKMIPDTFTLLLGLLPIVGYLVMLSVVRMSGRALVTTGGRDIAALGIAMVGLFAVGPAQLFFPEAAGTIFGPVVWIFLLFFYALCVTLIALSSRPRLVVYGRTPAEIYEPLLKACQALDPDAVGIRQLLKIEFPDSGISVRIDGFRGIDHAQIIAFEPGITQRFWDGVLANLRTEIRLTKVPVLRGGVVLFAAAVVLFGVLMWQGVQHQQVVVDGFRYWLWRQ